MEVHYTSPNGHWNRLTARIDGKAVGHMEWASATDEFAPEEITGLSVVRNHRRRGTHSLCHARMNYRPPVSRRITSS